MLPFDAYYSASNVQPESDTAQGAAEPKRGAQQRVVLPNYFAVLRVPLLAGRAFTAGDRTGAPNVAIVSGALARRDWPAASPLGRRVKYQSEWWTIVGIVSDSME